MQELTFMRESLEHIALQTPSSHQDLAYTQLKLLSFARQNMKACGQRAQELAPTQQNPNSHTRDACAKLHLLLLCTRRSVESAAENVR